MAGSKMHIFWIRYCHICSLWCLHLIYTSINNILDVTSRQSEWPSWKSLQLTNAGKGMERKETLLYYMWEGKLVSHYGEQYGVSFKKKTKNRLTVWSSNPALGHVLSCFSRVQLFVTLWSVACHVSLSMEFFKQQYWSGLPCPSPGDLPNPGIKPAFLMSPTLAGRLFTTNTTWQAHSWVYIQRKL